jgi:hypothetical protein
VRAVVALLATVTVTALVGGVVAWAGDAPGFYGDAAYVASSRGSLVAMNDSLSGCAPPTPSATDAGAPRVPLAPEKAL